MAISLDASTPASATSTLNTSGTTLVTGSFSPPANSMVVVMVSLGYGPSGSDPGLTVSDSNNNSYTLGPHVFDTFYDYAAVAYFYYTNAPGSITVTASRNSGTQASWAIYPYVLDGASSVVGASSTAFSATTVTSFTGSITTTVTGSWVLLASTLANTPLVTTSGSTTTISSFTSTGLGETNLLGRQTGTTGTPGATTLGWTTTGSSTLYAWAALEIVPSTNTGSVSTGFTFGSSVTGFSNSSSVSSGFTFGSRASGAPAGPIGIAQTVAAGDINDYGLDNIPFTMNKPFNPTSSSPGNALVAFIGWDVAFFPYQSTGKAPAVNVTDSAGNLWRQIGITQQQSGARAAIWIALNAQQVSWISVALTGWAYSTSYLIAEVQTPSTMQQVTIDFIQTANTNSAVTSLTVPSGTATTTDMCFAIICGGTNISNISQPSPWTALGLSGGASAYDATIQTYFINSQAAGSVPFVPTWTTAAPAAGIIVGLKATSAAPAQANPNYPRVVVEAAFGANPGDWTQSVDYTYSSEGITWTDITNRCIGQEGHQVISVARGRQYELSTEETGEMNITLDNHDGVFTLSNTASPYYPNCVPGTPIRVTAWWSQTAGNPVQYPVGFGYVERWPQDWPDLPQWGFTEITATDAYGPLASTTLPSAVEGDIRKDYPYAYFPTDEQYSFTTNSLTNITVQGIFLFGGTKIPIDANGFYAINKAFGNNRVGAYRDGGDGIPASTGQALNLMGDADSAFGTSNYPGVVPAIGGPVMFYSDPNIPTGTQPAVLYDTLVAASNPLAWWKLNDGVGTNAADSSGNGHAGTATSVTFRQANEAAALTGNTSALFSSASTSGVLTTYNPNPAAITVEAWVNLNNLTQATSFSRLVSNSFTQSDNKGFELILTATGAQFGVGNGTTNASAGGGTVAASGWAYVVGTWDGTTIRLYINGTQVATTSFSGSLAAGTGSGISLGYNSTFNGNYLTGLLAECAVYGSVLSPAQIASRYSPPATNSSGVTYEFWFLTGWESPNFKCTLLTAYAGPSAYYSPSDKFGAVLSIGINTGATPGLYINGTNVASQFTTPSFLGSNPNPQHLAICVSPSGVNVYLNGLKVTGGTPAIPAFNQIKAVMLGSGRYSYDNSTIVNYQGYNLVAGHLAIYKQELTPTMVLNHYTSGVNGFIGVTAPERFAQVLTWGLLGLKRGGCEWIQNHGTSENTTISEAYSYEGSTAGDVMGQLTQTEGGRCYTTANGTLVYMPRWALYNLPVFAVFGDNGTTEVPFSQDSGYSVDNTFIYNQINATQNRGPNTSVFYQQTNPASQLQFFNRSGLSIQSNAMSPFDTYAAVNWAQTKYNNPVQRVSQITVSPAKSQVAVNSAFTVVLGADLQDVVTVNRRPVGGSILTVTGSIQRIEHMIGPNEWDTNYQISPRFPDGNVLVADSAANNTLGNSYLAW